MTAGAIPLAALRADLDDGWPAGARWVAAENGPLLAQPVGSRIGFRLAGGASPRLRGRVALGPGERRGTVTAKVLVRDDRGERALWSGGLRRLAGRAFPVGRDFELALEPGAPIYHLTRVRTLSGRPVMIERGAYPDRVGILVAGMDLEKDSITERLEELGVVFTDAEHVMDAVAATAQDARLLGVSPRVPMLRERRLTTDPAGVPVEWSEDRYLGRAVAFSVHNSVAVNALSRTAARSRPEQAG